MPNRETEYRQALAQADACVEEAAGACAADPRRPIFHVMPKGRFMNDPNGPVYFNGEYHVFYQHLPFFGDERHDGRPYWGHAVSPDLVHWEQLPIALAPGPEPYDSGACASGGCVVRDGVPTIVYTGFAGKQVQCLAMSDDNGRTWRKYEGNPVVAAPPDIENLADGFRDPVVWQEDDEWRMLVGSAIQAKAVRRSSIARRTS